MEVTDTDLFLKKKKQQCVLRAISPACCAFSWMVNNDGYAQ